MNRTLAINLGAVIILALSSIGCGGGSHHGSSSTTGELVGTWKGTDTDPKNAEVNTLALVFDHGGPDLSGTFKVVDDVGDQIDGTFTGQLTGDAVSLTLVPTTSGVPPGCTNVPANGTWDGANHINGTLSIPGACNDDDQPSTDTIDVARQ